MIETQKYIKKPLVVNAVRVTTANFEDIAKWCQGEILQDSIPGQETKQYIHVRVHNPKNPRQTKAFVGDWLLYTERGYKVYTNKAFRESFDLMEEDATYPETHTIGGTSREDINVGISNGTPTQVEGKRVISVQEQYRMDADELKTLIQSGEVILEQDISGV